MGACDKKDPVETKEETTTEEETEETPYHRGRLHAGKPQSCTAGGNRTARETSLLPEGPAEIQEGL